MVSSWGTALLLCLQAVACLHALPISTEKKCEFAHLGKATRFGRQFLIQSATLGSKSGALHLRGGRRTERLNPFDALDAMSTEKQNTIGFLAVLFSVLAEVELIGFIGRKKLIPNVFARKLTHISVGCSMLFCLSLFPMGHSWPGRFAVACFLVAFIIAFGAGAYIPDDEFAQLPKLLTDRIQSLANSCSRSGDRSELCKGTLFYCIPVVMLVILYGSAPISVLAFSAVFVGDGIADPVGRTLGSRPSMQYSVAWFKNTKSYPGSLAFFLGTFLSSLGFGQLFKWAGHYNGIGFDQKGFTYAALLSALINTFVEAISPPDIDNLLIPMVTVMTCGFLTDSGRVPFLLSTKG